MPCVAALIIFSILGIFSISYRKLAKQALSCVLRKISFRPCEADFQTEIKAKIVGFMVRKNIKGHKFVYRQYDNIAAIFSLVFLASLLVSAFFSIRSIYNLSVYGTCDRQHPENCPLTGFENDPACSQIPKAFWKK